MPLDPALLAPNPARFNVSPELAHAYFQLFVNSPRYSVQASWREGMDKCNWYLAKDRVTDEPKTLTQKTIREHIDGDLTINLYAIDPATQRCRWVGVDGDYDKAYPDLIRLRTALTADGVEAAIELSRRGGHLWFFAETPLLASECRVYIYNVALRLGLPVRGGGIEEGLEIFPKQDRLEEGKLGSALRAPLGIHRRTRRRYWFIEADWNPEAQMAYLLKRKRLSEEQFRSLIEGMTMPELYQAPAPVVYVPYRVGGTGLRPAFAILDHVRPRKKDKRNHVAQCPSCARANKDKHRDNLHIKVADPNFYVCRAGCTKEDIREALGCPIPKRRFA